MAIIRMDYKNLSLYIRDETNDRGTCNHTINENAYNLTEDLKGKVVIDVGAFVGDFAIFAASKGAKVYAFEPDKKNYELLLKNIELNKVNVIPFNLAVGNPEIKEMFTYKNRPDWVTCDEIFNGQSDGKIEVTTISLNQVFKDNMIGYCDFLKLDCEGAEKYIIEEIKNGLHEKIDTIGAELHWGNEENHKMINSISQWYRVSQWWSDYEVKLTHHRMVTAVLITWKRQYNLPQIIENLLSYPFIDEIIIKDNSKYRNIINYGRYTSGRRAKNKIIYTQDDDCIVHNIAGIYSKFMENPNKVVYSGVEGYEDKIKDNIFDGQQMCMAGWGMMFNKEWIDKLDLYIKKFGKDECFYRETDRIFSMLQMKPHTFVPGGVTDLKGKGDEFALCNQPDHLIFKNLAIERCLKIK